MNPRFKIAGSGSGYLAECTECNSLLVRFQWVEGYDVEIDWGNHYDGETLGRLYSTERFWYVICPKCLELPTMFVPMEFINRPLND